MKTKFEYTLFDTSIGLCGVVWTSAGIAGIQLPEDNQAATRERIEERFPAAAFLAPPVDMEHAIDDIRAVISGESRDLVSIPLDWTRVAAFDRRVYEAARKIPFGATLTYGEVAARIGDNGAARAVGQALGRNPFAVIVPCHRVLAAGTKLGGFSAGGGTATKAKLLTAEGAIKGEQTSLF
ncbi:MAG: methylated-DNA--[protein]-cysteine S-methyltransferase [Bryobacteraceae bacterium]|nr:methylated-DNA--[protein]-cysteine S-methyltransferase [Bryobacteraceae bacterium]